jgi:hypothetical protein
MCFLHLTWRWPQAQFPKHYISYLLGIPNDGPSPETYWFRMSYTTVRTLQILPVKCSENSAFWDVMPCGCCKNGRFGGTNRLHYQVQKNQRARSNGSSNYRLLVDANVLGSPILVALMMEETHFSETSVLTRTTRRHVPEDGILYSHRRETPKSYILVTLTG